MPTSCHITPLVYSYINYGNALAYFGVQSTLFFASQNLKGAFPHWQSLTVEKQLEVGLFGRVAHQMRHFAETGGGSQAFADFGEILDKKSLFGWHRPA